MIFHVLDFSTKGSNVKVGIERENLHILGVKRLITTF